MSAPNMSVAVSSQEVGEITIVMRPFDMPYCKYIGTRMQIEAEGIIPVGTEWPEGFGSVEWEANGLNFWLRRSRPEGMKGPRRAFFDCDHWWLRIEVAGRTSYDEVIERKAKDLAREIYRQSAEGRAEWHKTWSLLYAARFDEKFQAFKALIPGLMPPPRKPRRPKSAAQSQEARHG